MSDEELALLIVFLEGVEHLLMSWGSGLSAHQIGHPAPSLSPEVCPHIIMCLPGVIGITTFPSPALLSPPSWQHNYAHNTRPHPGASQLHSLSHSSHCQEFLLLAVKFHESGKMTTTSVAMLAACSGEWGLLSELEQLARRARRNWCKLWSEARARTFAVCR